MRQDKPREVVLKLNRERSKTMRFISAVDRNRAMGISPTAGLLLLMYEQLYQGSRSDFSDKNMAKYMNMSHRTVADARRALTREGLLLVDKEETKRRVFEYWAIGSKAVESYRKKYSTDKELKVKIARDSLRVVS